MSRVHFSRGIAGILILCSLSIQGSLKAQEASTQGETLNTSENVKYPNGISEFPSNQNSGEFPLLPTVDTTPDPTIQVGPGVVVGPGVYVNGKPMANPLLKDVLPANHPLLINE